MLGRPCLRVLLGGFSQCWGLRCFVHFASSTHACVTFWMNSWPATENSRSDSPYRPACLKSVGIWSIRLCTASASWFWINWWNVQQKLKLYLVQRNVHTKVTWSPWLPVMISFFTLRLAKPYEIAQESCNVETFPIKCAAYAALNRCIWVLFFYFLGFFSSIYSLFILIKCIPSIILDI